MNAKLGFILRFALGAIFVAAGITKIVHPQGFFSDLLGYRVAFPEMFLRVVAVGLPWLEVLTGLALLANVWAETVRPMVSFLCLVFVAMLAQAVIRGLDLNCGCFGAGAHGWFERPDVALGRALLLFAASLYLTLCRSSPLPAAK